LTRLLKTTTEERMADSSNAARKAEAHANAHNANAINDAARGPMTWPLWFARTRPWLTGSAVLCTTLLGLILALEPATHVKTQHDVDNEEFVLLDDVDVYHSGSREESPLQVTEAPLLLTPGETYAQPAAGTSEVVQAGYTTIDGGIDVIRPVEYESSVSRGPQGAWLTGEIEEPAGAALKRSAEISAPATR
jgi:hypothetical protein